MKKGDKEGGREEAGGRRTKKNVLSGQVKPEARQEKDTFGEQMGTHLVQKEESAGWNGRRKRDKRDQSGRGCAAKVRGMNAGMV
eukprot:756543-Hanusia_phi.AAC.2